MGCLRGPRQELSGVRFTGTGREGPIRGETGAPLRRLGVGLTNFPTGTFGLWGLTLSDSDINLRTAPGDSAPKI